MKKTLVTREDGSIAVLHGDNIKINKTVKSYDITSMSKKELKALENKTSQVAVNLKNGKITVKTKHKKTRKSDGVKKNGK